MAAQTSPARPLFRRTLTAPWRLALACVLVALVSLYLQASTNTFAAGMGTDSGIFAYCGQRILHGDLLYRDCFDNKPPAVYYVNTLIGVLFGPDRHGIWWFQALWTAAAGVLFFLLARRLWGGLTGLLASLLLLFTAQQPVFYSGGNITETYTLLIQVLILWSLWRALQGEGPRIYMSIGLLTAAAFLFKPTYIVLGSAAALTALLAGLLRDRSPAGLRLALRRGLWMLGGLVLPLALIGLYFWARGGLDDLIFAVFIEPRAYVQGGFNWTRVKDVFQDSLFALPLSLLSAFAIAAALTLAWNTWQARPRRAGQTAAPAETNRRWMVFAALLSIPPDIFLTALSGREFGHYFLIPIPAMAVCAGYVIHQAAQGLRRREGAGAAAAAALLVLCLPWANAMFQQAQATLPNLRAFLADPPLGRWPPSELEQYIAAHSAPEDAVLVLSPHPDINLFARRRTPTRYIFPPHLLNRVQSGPNGIPELVSELRADPPALIVYQEGSAANIPDLRTDGEAFCPGCDPNLRAAMGELKEYISQNYEFDTQVWDFFIYRRIVTRDQ